MIGVDVVTCHVYRTHSLMRESSHLTSRMRVGATYRASLSTSPPNTIVPFVLSSKPFSRSMCRSFTIRPICPDVFGSAGCSSWYLYGVQSTVSNVAGTSERERDSRSLESLDALVLEVLGHDDVVGAHAHLRAQSVVPRIGRAEGPHLPSVDQFAPPDPLCRDLHVALWIYYARTLPCGYIRACQTDPRTIHGTTNRRAVDRTHESQSTTSMNCTYLERDRSEMFRRRCTYDLRDSVVSSI